MGSIGPAGPTGPQGVPGPAGPAGATGPAGASLSDLEFNDYSVIDTVDDDGDVHLLTVECAPGEQVISGGYNLFDNGFDLDVIVNWPQEAPDGWRVVVRNPTSAPDAGAGITLKVVCLAL